MSEHPHGWLSLLPPLVAIAAAISTRRIFSSLLAGILTGTLILAAGNPVTAILHSGTKHLWPSLISVEHLQVFTFTALMGALVGVMRQAGGFEAIVQALTPVARGRRSGQLTVWILGLIVFFDDYANSLLLGNTMRPLADRLRISRAKLAYLVDSTAAPVSGLALVSTWVAGEIGFIQDGLHAVVLAEPVDGFEIFVATIPYRFYVLWALLFVPLVALLDRDLPPMCQAEQAAQDDAPANTTASAATATAGHWWDAILPIVVVVGVTIGFILATGAAAVATTPVADRSWLKTFGSGDSYQALVYGALAGLMMAVALAWSQRALGLTAITRFAARGARQVFPALCILWLAWTLSGLTTDDHLGTGSYLAGVLRSSLDVRWMPTAVFLLASVVAFATGTSWGTMGILMPLAISVTVQLLTNLQEDVSGYDPLLLATVGSVLAGAIFGDHCSPISDTTVLSSQASGCDHIEHVRTQMPYALLVAGVSVAGGTIPVAYGVSTWLLLPGGLVVLLVLLLCLGKRVEKK